MKKSNFTGLTRIKTSVLVVTSAAFLILTGRFIYVPFIADWDVKFENGIFGFKWLSIFLSRFGNEVSWIAMGLLLIYLAQYLPKNHKKHIKNLSALILVTAGYFMAWIFYQESSFDRYTEMGFSLATSIMAYFVAKKLLKASFSHIESLKEKIRYLMRLMVVKTSDVDVIKDMRVYKAEIINPAIDKLDE